MRINNAMVGAMKKGVPKRIWIDKHGAIAAGNCSTGYAFTYNHKTDIGYTLKGEERKRTVRELERWIRYMQGSKYSFQIVDELKAKLNEMKGVKG
jgi:hypothetical protein